MNRLLALVLASAALVLSAVAVPVASAQDDPNAIPAPTVVLTKIGATPLIELSDGGGGLPYLGSARSYNAGDLTAVLTAYHDTGVYDTELGAGRRRRRQVPQQRLAAPGRPRRPRRRPRPARSRAPRTTGPTSRATATRRQWWNKKLAIVFDIDETALSNYSAIVADGFVYGPKSQAEATDEIGTAIRPTLDLYNLAKSKGITPFFVTGRPEAQRALDRRQPQARGLRRLQAAVPQARGLHRHDRPVQDGRAHSRSSSQGYRIVASVGDQYSDLAGGHEDTAFKLPEPVLLPAVGA